MQLTDNVRGSLRVLVAQGLVIVVSVLFALAVDRMVLGVDERALEHTYLEALSQDFGSVEASTAYLLRSAAMRDTASGLVLSTLRGNPPAGIGGIDLARALELSGWVIDIQTARVTWDDMVSTGRLGMLKNTGLRRSIATFYREVEQMEAFARDRVEMGREYSDVVQRILDPEVRVAIGSELREPIDERLVPEPVALTRKMTAEPRLLETLGDVLLINKVSTRMYADLDATARGIRAMLAEELRQWVHRSWSVAAWCWRCCPALGLQFSPSTSVRRREDSSTSAGRASV